MNRSSIGTPEPLSLAAVILSTPPQLFWAVSITALRARPKPSGIPEVPSGSKLPPRSPPVNLAAAFTAENFLPDSTRLEFGREEAAQTITGECERLFCDTLCAIFLGERNLALQQSLVMGAVNKKPKLNPSQHQRGGIRNWVEVWDYSADTIYRGFVASSDEQKSFFVFFENHVPGQGLKSGLVFSPPCPFPMCSRGYMISQLTRVKVDGFIRACGHISLWLLPNSRLSRSIHIIHRTRHRRQEFWLGRVWIDYFGWLAPGREQRSHQR